MYICLCKPTTEQQLKAAINNGHCTIKELQERCGVCTQCFKCAREIQEIIHGLTK